MCILVLGGLVFGCVLWLWLWYFMIGIVIIMVSCFLLYVGDLLCVGVGLGCVCSFVGFVVVLGLLSWFVCGELV